MREKEKIKKHISHKKEISKENKYNTDPEIMRSQS